MSPTGRSIYSHAHQAHHLLVAHVSPAQSQCPLETARAFVRHGLQLCIMCIQLPPTSTTMEVFEGVRPHAYYSAYTNSTLRRAALESGGRLALRSVFWSSWVNGTRNGSKSTGSKSTGQRNARDFTSNLPCAATINKRSRLRGSLEHRAFGIFKWTT